MMDEPSIGMVAKGNGLEVFFKAMVPAVIATPKIPPFFVVKPSFALDQPFGKGHDGLGFGPAVGLGFCRNADHFGQAVFIEVR